MTNSTVFSEQMTLSPEDAALLLPSLPEALVLLRNDCVIYANKALTALLGRAATEHLVGNSWHLLVGETQRPMVQKALSACLSVGRRELELRLMSARGEISVLASMAPVSLSEGPAVVLLVRDLSVIRQVEEQLLGHLNRDSLTGLANRALFYDRLEHEVVRAQRGGHHMVLMFIDCNRFKSINDSLGREVGNKVLREVADRLMKCCRQSDTVARLGGDEFTIILSDLSKGPDAERVTKRIIEDLGEPFYMDGSEVNLSVSIGLAAFPGDGDSSGNLIKNAEAAMAQAKTEGRGAYRFYTQDIHSEMMRRMSMERALSRALEEEQLVVHYQPIIDIQQGRLVAIESYLRWQHPDMGLVPPAYFLYIAEETKHTLSFTHWLLNKVCRQVADWRQLPGLEQLRMSVNLSCRHCRELLNVDDLEQLLEETGLPPECLVLEMTENFFLYDEVRAIEHLAQLKTLGVSLWWDDFGIGESSLGLLKRIPVDGIKVDQSLVAQVGNSEETADLVRCMMALVSALGRQIIGEGVEQPGQLQFLIENGCELAQGFHFAKPMPVEAFDTWLAGEGATFCSGRVASI